MKNLVRAIAFASAIPAVFAGMCMIHTKTTADQNQIAMIHAGTVPGPVPTCNPLTQACPNVRGK